jgi:autotransporter passenger strand-loop-strand repeat protein
VSGLVTGTILNGGVENVLAGGIDTGATVTHALQTISGGSVVGTTLGSGGRLSITSGAANGTTINSGGFQSIASGGTANGTTINNGGSETIASGGTAIGTAINNGGVQTISSGGVASGTVVLSGGTETVGSGGSSSNTLISGGTFDVAAGANVSGSISFVTAGGIYEIDTTVLPTNTIFGFVHGDTIDLAGIPFDPSGAATLQSDNTLQIAENGQIYQLTLDPSQDLAGTIFTLSSDGRSGTAITRSGPDTTAPVLSTNQPLSLTAGTSATITASLLNARDPDNNAAELTYTITSGPSHGALLDSGVAVSQFTQSDIDNGLVRYREVDTNSISDNFVFTVMDPAGNRTSSQFQFQVSPAFSSDVSLVDTSTGQSVPIIAVPYSGPVAQLQHQYIYPGTDNVNITLSDSNWFLKGGPGFDALQAFGGYNVLDGGTGSNFLTGGSGTDTFFVDDRSPPGDIWSTVNNFHQGDDATVFGIVQSPAVQWFDNQGAPGFTGLTLHVFGQNAPTASLTLVGYSSSDLSNGRLAVQFGNEPDGTAFMHVIASG